jgi:hypothetical protein
MTPEELNNALQSAALTYVREVKQQDVPFAGQRTANKGVCGDVLIPWISP